MKRKKLKMWNPTALLMKSKADYDGYKKTGDSQKIAEAGEKIWNAFILYVSGLAGRRLVSFHAIENRINKIGDGQLLDVFGDAYHMHAFFHAGWTEDITMEEEKWNDVYNYLKGKVG